MNKYVELAKRIMENSDYTFDISVSKNTLGEFDVDLGERTKSTEVINGKSMYLSYDLGEFVNKSYNLDKVKCVLLCYFDEPDFDTNSKINIDGKLYDILEITDIKAGKETAVKKIVVGE